MSNTQDLIMRSFFTNEEYMRRVVPFIEPSYFEGVHKELFKLFVKYVAKYNGTPSLDTFKILIEENGDNFSEDMFRHALDIAPSMYEKVDGDKEWMIETTEKWCQDRAVFNAVMESITIIDGKHQTLTKNALPDILSKALAVSFDTNIGHDYTENSDKRYDYYHQEENRIPFDLELFNTITKGGLPNKTLNIILAGTGVGKSLIMCHMAGNVMIQGKNVLYITMEMAEERIAERIDANLFDIPIDQIETLSRDMFKKKVDKITSKTNGKLIIKEYATGSAHSGHFRALLNELKLKKKFVPDMIFIDYLNICACAKIKNIGGSVNTYSYIKTIAEELRSLAVEFNVPIMSATQTNRQGFTSSDPGLDDTSESFGLPATADFMFVAVTNDELDAMNQLMIKQLKNRYSDPNHHKRFCVGINRSKMKLFDVTQDQKIELVKDTPPVFDNTKSGGKLNMEGFKV